MTVFRLLEMQALFGMRFAAAMVACHSLGA